MLFNYIFISLMILRKKITGRCARKVCSCGWLFCSLRHFTVQSMACMILGTIKIITRMMMMIDLIVARACARFRLAALQRWHILLRAHHHYHQHQHQQWFYATLLLWCAWILQSMTLPQFWFWNSWNVQCEKMPLKLTFRRKNNLQTVYWSLYI